MPQVLQRFRQRAPKVRLSLQSLNCYVIRDALLNDEADVGVFYRVGNDDALNRRELGEQSLVLVASPQIADVDFTEPEDITPVALLSTNRNVSSGRYLRARCVKPADHGGKHH
ncbi:substrate-binding domain-containing protein [Escherichia coli]